MPFHPGRTLIEQTPKEDLSHNDGAHTILVVGCPAVGLQLMYFWPRRTAMGKPAPARGHLVRAATGLLCCAFGCTEMVTIYSEPTGAKCFIDGAFRGETPLETPVTSWALTPSPIIRLEKEGREPFEGKLRKKFQFWYIILAFPTCGVPGHIR